MRLKVHHTAGDGKGWALDEDLRQIRLALHGIVKEVSAPRAQVIHAPFWQNLAMVEPSILRRAFVIAHADNPPFFYVKQPEFAAGQSWVDLWLARSREALDQFHALNLPAIHIPYTIDPGLFFPIEDKKKIRREFGIPEDAYVISNFHRDTEGGDLRTPKFQKAPELMVSILKRVRDAGVPFHVLLAGPRRHWIREELAKEGIPFTFVGKAGVAGDDFGVNILSRERLNKLYNASDLYLIPSRWEGGPQSTMEAAACRCKVLSAPIGVSLDILEPSSIFQFAREAASQIMEDMHSGVLNSTIEPQFERWQKSHATPVMMRALRDLYNHLPETESFQQKISGFRTSPFFDAWEQVKFTLRRRTSLPRLPKVVRWNHLPGQNLDLDEIMAWVRETLEMWKVSFTNSTEAECDIAGWTIQDGHSRRNTFQFIVPGFPVEKLLPGATLVMPSVQDILNLRSLDISNPSVVLSTPAMPDIDSSDPLLVHKGDRNASLRIFRALAAGRPVIYPNGFAYREQIFWAGLTYDEDPSVAFQTAISDQIELRQQAKSIDPAAAQHALRKLISI